MHVKLTQFSAGKFVLCRCDPWECRLLCCADVILGSADFFFLINFFNKLASIL
jgi:hypothetical protein